MAEQLTERDLRIQKLQVYQTAHGTAYPSNTGRTHMVSDVLERFAALGDQSVIVAGRVRYWRDHGKLTFAHVEDTTGKIQVVFELEKLGDIYNELSSYDVGDIIEVHGMPFTTQKGESSLLVSAVTLLAKALQPLPDKWHGLQDEEMRHRKRYVDMLMRPELREVFVKKGRFWNSMRSFLIEEGFLEVETPVLETTPGGADAEPFVTHHNALDIDVYLRISMGELWQKRLMVAGYEKTFEIGRQFRNEGMSPEHLQDYTQMEFYWGFANYEDTMKLVERMYKHCIMKTFGTLEFSIRGYEINLDQTWERLDYTTVIRDHLQIDVLEATTEELQAKCKSLTLEAADLNSRGRLIDALMKQCRKNITGPAFLVNHPVEVSPLAKRSVADPRVVERYQVVFAGSELGNGYSELNDPIDQRERFEEQARLREAGDAEAQMHDADFVDALEVGMPPTSGFGVSERLFSFLMDQPIKECVMFPLLRPKQMAESNEEPGVTTGDTSQDIVSNEIQPAEIDPTNDVTLQPMEVGMTREEALAYMHEHVTDVNLRKHMWATEVLMKALAKRLGAASPEAWGIAGLLHDVDYQNVDPDQHSLVGADMLTAKNVHPEIVNAVREHNYHHGIPAKTMMSKAMQSLEQLTGLVMASVLVRPDKSLAALEVKSVKKKFKDKSFAKGVDRAFVGKCEEMVGIPLDEAIEICIFAMQGIAKELEME